MHYTKFDGGNCKFNLEPVSKFFLVSLDKRILKTIKGIGVKLCTMNEIHDRWCKSI